MRAPPDLRLPRSRRRWALALTASVVVHALALVFGSIGGRVPILPPAADRLIVLPPPAPPDTAPLAYREARDRAPVAPRRPPRRERPVPPTRPAPPPDASPPARPEASPAPPPGDTAGAPGAAPRAPAARIGPDLGRGRLWVRPLPLPPRELAERITGERHAELVDSAVTAVVQAFLDSIAADPNARRPGLPSWATEVAGVELGVDSQHIRVAGLKIPAAVLALLPLEGGTNVDRDRAWRHLMDVRTDLEYAAQRAATAAEFKEAVRQIRGRREREREFERNRRTPPQEGDSAP